ncbi:MAG: DUF2207 domain-containing protein, partial [Alphaproteobacteria bacterium]|nr:DUF2207 domain-containing protein [Alphaproteobacteria bacterium]
DTQQQSEMSEQGKLEKQLAETATRFFTLAEDESKNVQPEVPTVAIALPSGRKILAPAREHIPYFLSYIDIQSNGYVKIEDTIIIVANNQKFASGLQRVFSKNYGRRKLDFILESVTVNNTKVPYTLEEMGDNIILKPKYNQKLASGVYTYKFNYVVNNLLVPEKDQVFFDWNIVGTPLNTLITSANAIVTIPMGHSFDAVQSVVGKGRLYTDRRTNVIPLENYAVAFSNTTPMFNGEDMLVMANMNKNIFLKNFDQNLNTFLLNWGNTLYSGLGFLAIFISFILSLITLKYDRKNNKYTPSYDGSLMRHIQIGKFDRVAFVAQILNLFRKNALDIMVEDNRVYLKRKTEPVKLSGFELKAIKCLFPKKRITTEVNNTNTLQLKKAKKVFEKQNVKAIKKFRLIHNIGYILFSCGMLLLTEIFVAINGVNMAQSLVILLTTTLLYAFYVWLLLHKFKHWYTALIIRLFSLVAIAVIWVFSSIYIGRIASLLIVLTLGIIFEFVKIFNIQNNFINEAKDSISKYREYLVSNAESINLGKTFLNQQAGIFALDIVEYFPKNASNSALYRLDMAEKLKQVLIGII